MNSSKLFKFMEQKSEDVMEIIVPEYINPEYGMYVWPCAPVLAQFIWKNRQKVKNKNVLEIGAGTALPGIMAAKCGADVILSDSARLLECQQNCRRTCLDNNIKDIPVIGLTWGEFNPSLLELGNIDIILASDCFYETKDFEEVIVTVSFILKRNPLCEFWCTYQE
ncbi:hypothetical protein LOTGIDRAFT_168192 [Lottia gigantea]|uniref:Methyltransferase-like protein 23 n=1 Tax=Lottia gigantea TaxID=225164 RepID=V3ZVI2_LOTGI|nr:hypothetical protein LOTGIDRAFT_168192 [Lottia gigantea]ESO84936.1 hypothetical protein LOTGIDRAFT_168192 [Lottia gigantea]